jgi:predicted dehydrogenase
MDGTGFEPLGWGLIGAGDIAQRRVAPAMRDLDSCRCVSVSRADAGRLDAFAGKFGFLRGEPDWRKLINDPEVEAVYIATPVYLHEEQTLAALEAGKPVLCEKPMALNSQGARRMITAAAVRGLPFGVAYYRRFFPVVERIRQILADGLIGEPVLAVMENFEPFHREPGEPRSWLLDPRLSGGGPLMDMGCHRVDLLIHLFGPAEDVTGRADNLRFQRPVEDSATLVLGFRRSLRAVLLSAHCAFEPRDTLEIYGTHGTIRLPNLNRGDLILITEKGETRESHPIGPNVHAPLIDDFSRAVREKRAPLVTGEIALATSEVLDSFYNRGINGRL